MIASDTRKEEPPSKSIFHEAFALFESGQFVEAWTMLTGSCMDDPRCLALLGDMEFLGLPPSRHRNWAKAADYWQRAGDRGSSEGQYMLAALMDLWPELAVALPLTDAQRSEHQTALETATANGVTLTEFASILREDGAVDEREAWPSLAYFYAAAVGNHPGAQLAMAEKFMRGLGVGGVGHGTLLENEPAGVCGAAAWYLVEAARPSMDAHVSGIPQALEVVVLSLPQAVEISTGRRTAKALHMLISESLQDPQMVLNVALKTVLGVDGHEQDYVAARQLIEALIEGVAAFEDHTLFDDPTLREVIGRALGTLGYLYALGLGMEKDIRTAVFYFTQAAEDWQDPSGWNGLGYAHFNGVDGIERDLTKAVHYFQKSAEKMHPDGLFNLGVMHLNGQAEDAHVVRGLDHITQASSQGHTAASYVLGMLALNGVLMDRNCSLALKHLRLVAEKRSWVTQHIQRAHGSLASASRASWMPAKLTQAVVNPNSLSSVQWTDLGAFHLWKLAAAGVDSARTALAVLLESGRTDLFYTRNLPQESHEVAQHFLGLIRNKTPDVQLSLGLIAYAGTGWDAEARLTPAELIDDSSPVLDIEGQDLRPWLHYEETVRRRRESIEDVKSDDASLPAQIEQDHLKKLLRLPRTALVAYGHFYAAANAPSTQTPPHRKAHADYFNKQRARAMFYMFLLQLRTGDMDWASQTLDRMSELHPRSAVLRRMWKIFLWVMQTTEALGGSGQIKSFFLWSTKSAHCRVLISIICLRVALSCLRPHMTDIGLASREPPQGTTNENEMPPAAE